MQMAENKAKSTKTHGFQPGQSGNPGGRPKMPEEFKELAKKYSLPALKVAISIMENPKEKASDRLRAVELIQDRAYGKPKQDVGIEGDMTFTIIKPVLPSGD